MINYYETRWQKEQKWDLYMYITYYFIYQYWYNKAWKKFSNKIQTIAILTRQCFKILTLTFCFWLSRGDYGLLPYLEVKTVSDYQLIKKTIDC